MPLTIRPATKDDVPAILKIERQSASAAHWKTDQYDRLLKNGLTLVAESEGILKGFVCANTAVAEWELENIVVADRARRRGIADALLAELLNVLQTRSGVSLWLEVRESNHPARSLYEKHGFRKTGVRRSYYRDPVEDAVLYEWRAHCEA